MEREILTLHETADYLLCSPGTIYRLLRRGEIPAFRIGTARGGWRFMREPLDNWMESHTLSPLTGRRKRVSTYGPPPKPWASGRTTTTRISALGYTS